MLIEEHLQYDMAQFVGKVVGTQMMKTAKVEVTKMVLHPHVLKVCSFSSNPYSYFTISN